ncbi:unnamed protein product [Symbiodinium sp. CCMP2592]|nr:unnamed protein product [Symbiodinium sp. CCMP2592]
MARARPKPTDSQRTPTARNDGPETAPPLTQEIAGQPTTHGQRRPESLAGRLVAPDDIPAKQKASDPYQVATASGNVTFSNDLGLQTSEPDAGVGLKPLFILFVAGIFFLLLVAVCVILPRLQGVTLGIAGTLEERRTTRDTRHETRRVESCARCERMGAVPNSQHCATVKVDGACLRVGPMIGMRPRCRDFGFTVHVSRAADAAARPGTECKISACSHAIAHGQYPSQFPPQSFQIECGKTLRCLRPAMSSPDPPTADFFPNLLEDRDREGLGKSQGLERSQRSSGSLRLFKATAATAQPDAADAAELKKDTESSFDVEGVLDVLVALRCFLPLH